MVLGIKLLFGNALVGESFEALWTMEAYSNAAVHHKLKQVMKTLLFIVLLMTWAQLSVGVSYSR